MKAMHASKCCAKSLPDLSAMSTTWYTKSSGKAARRPDATQSTWVMPLDSSCTREYAAPTEPSLQQGPMKGQPTDLVPPTSASQGGGEDAPKLIDDLCGLSVGPYCLGYCARPDESRQGCQALGAHLCKSNHLVRPRRHSCMQLAVRTHRPHRRREGTMAALLHRCWSAHGHRWRLHRSWGPRRRWP
eukprot:scaffold768_cov382-Prasinococcus_capsulatus_cf.AAC.5